MILIAVNSTKSEHNTNDNSPNNIFHNKHPNQKHLKTSLFSNPINFPKVPTFLSLNAIHLIKEETARKMSQRRKVALKTYLVIRYLF